MGSMGSITFLRCLNTFQETPYISEQVPDVLSSHMMHTHKCAWYACKNAHTHTSSALVERLKLYGWYCRCHSKGCPLLVHVHSIFWTIKRKHIFYL